MPQKSLKMTTAIFACLSISLPAPIWAQDPAQGFPCVAPDGSEVVDPEMLSNVLLQYFSAGTPSEEFGTCDVVAVQSAFDFGGEDLEAALAAAPAELQAQLPTTDENSNTAEAEVEPEVVSENKAEADAEVEADASLEAKSESEAEVAAETEADPQAETAAETENADLANKPVEDTEVEEGASEAEPEGELAAQDDSTDVATTEGETSDQSVSDPTPAEETASVEEENTSETDAVETAEEIDQPTEVEEAEIAEVVSGAGEAGGEQLTDEERQALNQERDSDAENVKPAAAASVEGEDDDAAEAELETEVVEETDVRRSDEDFETAAVGNAQVTAANQDDGLSKFEKALLLGLGAAVVGSVLNNGDQVVSNSGDRVIIERDGELRVLKNDDELLRRPGAQVQTQTFQDGSTRSVLTYEDGGQIITVRANDGTVLRRTLIRAQDGVEVVLFDDTKTSEPIAFDELPAADVQQDAQVIDTTDQDALRDALQAALVADVNRQFSLQQIRDFKRVRNLAPEVALDQITFATGSAAIQPAQARELRALGQSMVNIIEGNPQAVFLVEGHTDAVGSASYNLSLSDRRAETVALALTEYFGVPPQNLITQGYGETDLKIQVLTDERANRRASVRNITRLLNRS